MVFEIYEGDSLINTIAATEEFVAAYCEGNGYTYKLRASVPEAEEPSETERLRADLDYLSVLLGVSL